MCMSPSMCTVASSLLPLIRMTQNEPTNKKMQSRLCWCARLSVKKAKKCYTQARSRRARRRLCWKLAQRRSRPTAATAASIPITDVCNKFECEEFNFNFNFLKCQVSESKVQVSKSPTKHGINNNNQKKMEIKIWNGVGKCCKWRIKWNSIKLHWNSHLGNKWQM